MNHQPTSTVNDTSRLVTCPRHGWTFADPWTGGCRTCTVTGGPRPPARLAALLLAVLLLVGCGANSARPAVQVAPGQATPTEPSTTTTVATTVLPPDTAPSSPKEPPLPDGARHGDQPEVVEHFGEIAGDGDCDWLRTERDADGMARDDLMARRAEDPGNRGRAEVADRWMQAAQNRMRNLRCPVQSPLAGTP